MVDFHIQVSLPESMTEYVYSLFLLAIFPLLSTINHQVIKRDFTLNNKPLVIWRWVNIEQQVGSSSQPSQTQVMASWDGFTTRGPRPGPPCSRWLAPQVDRRRDGQQHPYLASLQRLHRGSWQQLHGFPPHGSWAAAAGGWLISCAMSHGCNVDHKSDQGPGPEWLS